MEPLAITAARLLTPLDTPEQTTFDAIRAGAALADAGIVAEAALRGPLRALDGPRPAALSLEQYDKSLRLGLRVAGSALHAAAWSQRVYADARTGLFCGTSKGPVTTALRALDTLRADGPAALPAAVARQLAAGPAALADFLAVELSLAGPRQTSVAACSSGLHALHAAASAIRRGELDRALVVASDASVLALFTGSFARLGVLATPDADGQRRCRPFDPAGGGFFLTEAAVAVTLERAGTRPALAALERTWVGGDGTHLVAIDADAASLRRGLRWCAADGPFDFVHAHATGTAHDAHELSAIHSVVSPQVPVFSHKRWLGHALGAAGLVGVVLSLQCQVAGVTLTGTPLPLISRSATISQGFGGHIGIATLRVGAR